MLFSSILDGWEISICLCTAPHRLKWKALCILEQPYSLTPALVLHVKQYKWPESFFFLLSSGWFSSHLPGKNAGDFHILTAICSFLSEAHQVFLAHRKHIEIDCVHFCVWPQMSVSLKCPLEWFFFFFFLICLPFNRILLLSCTFALCCHNDDLSLLREEEYIYSQVKHTCNVNFSF